MWSLPKNHFNNIRITIYKNLLASWLNWSLLNNHSILLGITSYNNLLTSQLNLITTKVSLWYYLEWSFVKTYVLTTWLNVIITKELLWHYLGLSFVKTHWDDQMFLHQSTYFPYHHWHLTLCLADLAIDLITPSRKSTQLGHFIFYVLQKLLWQKISFYFLLGAYFWACSEVTT